MLTIAKQFTHQLNADPKTSLQGPGLYYTHIIDQKEQHQPSYQIVWLVLQSSLLIVTRQDESDIHDVVWLREQGMEVRPIGQGGLPWIQELPGDEEWAPLCFGTEVIKFFICVPGSAVHIWNKKLVTAMKSDENALIEAQEETLLWKNRYLVEKTLRTRIAKLMDQTKKRDSMLEIMMHKTGLNFDFLDEKGFLDDVAEEEFQVHEDDLVVVDGQSSFDATRSRAIGMQEHKFDAFSNEFRRTTELKFDDDYYQSRVWVCSWNMGVKDVFKIPLDAPPKIRDAEIDRHLDHLSEIIPIGYDLYVFGVQECITDQFYNILSIYFRKHGIRRVPLDPDLDRIWGRGDGSFISPKYTGIALYISNSLSHDFAVLNSGGANLSLFEGSKGGAGVAVRIRSSTLAFVSCHLPAKSLEDRRRGYRGMSKQIGSLLGEKHFELTSQFHHVVFFGDLNYRTKNLTLEDAVEMIQMGNLEELQMHDELQQDLSEEKAFVNYWEPKHNADFYPTYKKKENRPDKTDFDDPDWARLTYKTLYKEPWYKSGKVQPRMPSFCDRIMIHSMRRSPSVFVAEENNYSAFNDHLHGSDHSAIYCGFHLQDTNLTRRRLEAVRESQKVRNKTELVYRVRILQFAVLYLGERVYPRSINAMFPAPFEDGNDRPDSQKISREALASEIGKWRNLNDAEEGDVDWSFRPTILRWAGPAEVGVFHILFRVALDDDLAGECVSSLNLTAFEEGELIRQNNVRLFRHGLPLFDDNGSAVFVEYDLRLSRYKLPVRGTNSFGQEFD